MVRPFKYIALRGNPPLPIGVTTVAFLFSKHVAVVTPMGRGGLTVMTQIDPENSGSRFSQIAIMKEIPILFIEKSQ